MVDTLTTGHQREGQLETAARTNGVAVRVIPDAATGNAATIAEKYHP